MAPLTQEQQEFAEQHHSLVYTFLRYKQLDIDTNYDIVIFGYLNAVKDYIEKQPPYSFSTIAYRHMQDMLYEDYRYRNRLKRKGNPLSLEQPIGEDNFCLADVLADDTNICEDFIANEIVSEILNTLSKMQQEAVLLKCRGYQREEIAKIQGTRPKNIDKRFSFIRPKIKKSHLAYA